MTLHAKLTMSDSQPRTLKALSVKVWIIHHYIFLISRKLVFYNSFSCKENTWKLSELKILNPEKRQYLHIFYKKGFKGTVVNRTLRFFHLVSIEKTRTVPLTIKCYLVDGITRSWKSTTWVEISWRQTAPAAADRGLSQPHPAPNTCSSIHVKDPPIFSKKKIYEILILMLVFRESIESSPQTQIL